jgi:PPM family protein phosphatase
MSLTTADSVTSPVHLDSFGLSDRGRRRETNEDHFVIAHLSKAISIAQSSVSPEALAGRFGVESAHLLAVADGVGGRADGEIASGRTLTAVLQFLGRAAGCFHGGDITIEHDLLQSLEGAVRDVHNSLFAEFGGERAEVPATTLTLLLLVWPRAYVVHVGDSRAYVRRRGRLQRLTRDQTLGQHMFAAGVWTEEQAERAGAPATLTSAVGGTELIPVVGLVDLEAGDSALLCTDGLTKHVPDERIAEVLAQSWDAQTTSQRLVAEALEAGGSDNVTVVVLRSAAA